VTQQLSDAATPTWPVQYGRPAAISEYLPDALEPIDRWLQAANSSNVRTTRAIIEDLCPEQASALVDPFAGVGSSASTARLMGIPFFGIEYAPAAAVVALAKATATIDDARALETLPPVRPHDEATDWMDLGHVGAGAVLRLVQEAVAATGGTLATTTLIEDLERSRPPAPSGTVTAGDATAETSWSTWSAPGHAVIYTSPPFGESSPQLAFPAYIHRASRDLLTLAGLSCSAPSTADIQFATYEHLVLGMMRQAIEHLSSATVIIEHEAGDDGTDRRHMVARALEDDFGHAVTDVRILETGAFSRRGLLSFIVCEIKR
jgi:hypothetical protein